MGDGQLAVADAAEAIRRNPSDRGYANLLLKDFDRALKRYRSKGEQRVIVERVTVEKGGQAIVGNVAHREG
jgi:hypothetical protein